MFARRCAVLLAAAGPSAPASGDPFATLELKPTASREEVKKAYRDLAKKYHPDSGNGDAAKMEAVNRSYNLLIKENAYDDLHQSAPDPSETPVGAAGPDDFQRVIFDKTRLANLDSKTERITAEGKFMYADRDTGEWVTLDRPLSRPEQPRYASHGKFRRDTDLFNEIKKRQQAQDDLAKKKTRFQKYVVEKTSHSLPYNNPYLIVVAIAIYVVSMYFVYQRALSKRNILFDRWDYYSEIRDHRFKVRDVYPVFQNECDTVAAAAAIVFLAASEKTAPDAPIQPALPTDLQAKAPNHYYLLYNCF